MFSPPFIIAFLGISAGCLISCNETRSGHAHPVEDALLLQVDKSGKRLALEDYKTKNKLPLPEAEEIPFRYEEAHDPEKSTANLSQNDTVQEFDSSILDEKTSLNSSRSQDLGSLDLNAEKSLDQEQFSEATGMAENGEGINGEKATLITKEAFPLLLQNPKPPNISKNNYAKGKKRVAEVRGRVENPLKRALQKRGFSLGSPVFIRVLKQERIVEIFMQKKGESAFSLLHTYNIAAMSGDLGPKKREGDRQAPEGFYFVAKRHFNPQSSYHLSFNIGYPNAYDTSHKRTGSFIMMHGARASIGCYAMTDPAIEEIYLLCQAALNSGKQRFFRFHVFPFRMNAKNMQLHAENENIDFWRNLKQGYDYFEEKKMPPNVEVKNKRYNFR